MHTCPLFKTLLRDCIFLPVVGDWDLELAFIVFPNIYKMRTGVHRQLLETSFAIISNFPFIVPLKDETEKNPKQDPEQCEPTPTPKTSQETPLEFPNAPKLPNHCHDAFSRNSNPEACTELIPATGEMCKILLEFLF